MLQIVIIFRDATMQVDTNKCCVKQGKQGYTSKLNGLSHGCCVVVGFPAV